MSPVAISGVDKQGVAINGVQVKQALSAANSTVNKGVYDATLLETVDADLAVGNIINTATIFGKAGTVAPMDVSDADAAVGDVKDPKTFYSVAAPRKTGTMPTVALDPALNAYPAGYHAGAASLTAVDADLVAAKIKSGATIFGVAGSVIPGGTETIERYYDSSLADTATYTPANSGIFSGALGVAVGDMEIKIGTLLHIQTHIGFSPCIGDGTNLHIKNLDGADRYLVLMRHYISTGTYQSYASGTLIAGAAYTPGASGLFSASFEIPSNLWAELYSTGATAWGQIRNWGNYDYAAFLVVGDGTNLRFRNNYTDTRAYHILRAIMT